MMPSCRSWPRRHSFLERLGEEALLEGSVFLGSLAYAALVAQGLALRGGSFGEFGQFAHFGVCRPLSLGLEPSRPEREESRRSAQ